MFKISISNRRVRAARVGTWFVLSGAVAVASHPALADGTDGGPIQLNQVTTPSPEAEEAYPVGDFNLNHTIDLDDVTACALAWHDLPAYFQSYPSADAQTLNTIGDFTGDGLFDGQDIEPYKTFVVGELIKQQGPTEQPGQESELRSPNSVVWVNDTLPEASPEAEPGEKDVLDPTATDPTETLSFINTPSTRTATNTGGGAKVFTGAGNSGGGGGGGGGGASVVSGGGGGGGGGSGGGTNVISGGGSGIRTSGTGSNTVTNQNSGGGSVSVVGGGSTGVVVAGGKPNKGATATGSGTGNSLSGGQDNTELRSPNAAVAPIEHEANYRGEAELFGYAPRYEPNYIAFDLDNKPYIRVAGNIQTQGVNSNWVDLPLADAVTQYFQSINRTLSFQIPGGQFIDQRITFDARGDAYTVVLATSGANWYWFLMHSRDKCVTWKAYPLPGVSHIRIEFNDGNNALDQPPAVLVLRDKYLGLVLPTRKSDGTLSLPNAITVTEESLLSANHSGGANSVISVGDKVFVIYPLSRQYQQSAGTSQFIKAYNRATGQLVMPQTLLGSVGDEGPDAHYIPAITADSSGYLHVVLGCHHDNVYYIKSDAPRDASSWSASIAVGANVVNNGGGHTYPSLLCDSNDQLHIVTRWAGDKDNKYHLVYITGNARTGVWQAQKTLVSPFRQQYSIWYHHLSMDREGRLFLNYRYLGNQLNAEQLAAYRQKWPNDIPANAQPYPLQQTIPEIKSHDPAVLLSENSGADWKLATSPNLFGGQ